MPRKEYNIYLRYALNNLSHSIYSPSFILQKRNTIEGEEEQVDKVLRKIEEAKSIINKLEFDEMPVNYFFNYLVLIDHLPIPEVHALLKEHNYYEKMDKSFKRSFRAINKNEMPKEEDKDLLEFLINRDLLNKHEKEIYEFYIKRVLSKEKPKIGERVLRSVLRNYSKLIMSDFTDSAKAYTKPETFFETNKMCIADKDVLYINEAHVKRMISNGSYSLLYKMFHEIKHIEHFIDVHIKKKTDDKTMTIIKDEILEQLYPDYATKNKTNRKDEAESILYSRKMIIELFDRLGLDFPRTSEFSDKSMKNCETQTKYVVRQNAMGDYIQIDNMFEESIMYHPEFIDKYEQLKQEYVVDDKLKDIVIKK